MLTTDYFFPPFWIAAQLPSGYIHWTVAVIPLGGIVFLLFGVISFQLWLLKWRTRKQRPEILIDSTSSDVHTKSILNTEQKKKNNCAFKPQNRVRFQEQNLGQVHDCCLFEHEVKADTASDCPDHTAITKSKTKMADCLISRHLGIKRKRKNELQSKYPLNAPLKDDTSQPVLEEFSENRSNPDIKVVLDSSPDCLGEQDSACAQPDTLNSSDTDFGRFENQISANFSHDTLCYLEILHE